MEINGVPVTPDNISNPIVAYCPECGGAVLCGDKEAWTALGYGDPKQGIGWAIDHPCKPEEFYLTPLTDEYRYL